MWSFFPSSKIALIAAVLFCIFGLKDVLAAPAHSSSALSEHDIARVKAHLLGKRDGFQAPFNGFPGCQGYDGDPTYAVGDSSWKDGEGVYIGSDCDNHDAGDNHCWTDYYIIGTANSYDQWYEAMGDIFCPVSRSCSGALGQAKRVCVSFTVSISETLKLVWDVILFKIEESVTYTIGTTYQSCYQASSTETCTWKDGCHSIWAAQQITTVYGYMRRSGNAPLYWPGANMPNQTQRADGYYTRGMLDFAIPFAGPNIVDCQGGCEADYLPGALPPLDDSLKPWPSDWKTTSFAVPEPTPRVPMPTT